MITPLVTLEPVFGPITCMFCLAPAHAKIRFADNLRSNDYPTCVACRLLVMNDLVDAIADIEVLGRIYVGGSPAGRAWLESRPVAQSRIANRSNSVPPRCIYCRGYTDWVIEFRRGPGRRSALRSTCEVCRLRVVNDLADAQAEIDEIGLEGGEAIGWALSTIMPASIHHDIQVRFSIDAVTLSSKRRPSSWPALPYTATIVPHVIRAAEGKLISAAYSGGLFVDCSVVKPLAPNRIAAL